MPMCQKRLNILDQAFVRIDANSDGFLDKDDLRSWLKSTEIYANMKHDMRKEEDEELIDQV